MHGSGGQAGHAYWKGELFWFSNSKLKPLRGTLCRKKWSGLKTAKVALCLGEEVGRLQTIYKQNIGFVVKCL